MKEHVDKLKNSLNQLGWDITDLLRDPMLDCNELKHLMEQVYQRDIYFDPSLCSLYQYSDGMTYVAEDMQKSYIAPHLYFNNFNEALKIVQEDDFYNFKESLLFPVFQSLLGEYVVTKLEENNSTLYYCSTFDYEIDNVVSIYDSLESFTITTIKFTQEKIIVVDSDGYLGLDIGDYELYLKTGLECNPKSEYWKQKLSYIS